MALVLHEPTAMIHRLGPIPILMVVADKDSLCTPPPQLDMFERALQPKRLCILKGASHFDPYYGAPFEKNIKAQIEFLEEFVEAKATNGAP